MAVSIVEIEPIRRACVRVHVGRSLLICDEQWINYLR